MVQLRLWVLVGAGVALFIVNLIGWGGGNGVIINIEWGGPTDPKGGEPEDRSSATCNESKQVRFARGFNARMLTMHAHSDETGVRYDIYVGKDPHDHPCTLCGKPRTGREGPLGVATLDPDYESV